MLIPSELAPSARAVLEQILVPDVHIQIAAAFVSDEGVELLAQLVSGLDAMSLEVVARAADITSPEALIRLREELRADVKVVIGRGARRFHPKLWLIHAPTQLHVLSGSGNLTVGGMEANDEQFELVTLDLSDQRVADETRRFTHLTRSAYPLDQVRESRHWKDWLEVRAATTALRLKLAGIERKLDYKYVPPGPEPRSDESLPELVKRNGTTLTWVLVNPTNPPMLHRRDCKHPHADASWRQALDWELRVLPRCKDCLRKDD